jgi:hypothetical protein
VLRSDPFDDPFDFEKVDFRRREKGDVQLGDLWSETEMLSLKEGDEKSESSAGLDRKDSFL